MATDGRSESNNVANEGDMRRGRRIKHPGSWGIRAAWIVLLVGLIVSGVAALYRRANLRHGERATFHSVATDVSATFADGLKRDVDLIATLRAVATMRPGITTAELERWQHEIGRFDAQAAQFGTAVISVVPSARLAAFSERFEADPVNHALTGGTFRIVPGGTRPQYCLISAWLSPLTSTASELPFPLTVDFCAESSSTSAPQSIWLALQRDVDSASVNALSGLPGVPAGTSLILTAAVYRRGAPTGTIAEREAALQGWVGTGFDLHGLLSEAIGSRHAGLIVDVYERGADGERSLVARSGAGGRELTYSRAVTAGGRWTVVVGGDLPNATADDLRALAVFLIGTLISLLAFLLFRRIGRARDHAVELLQERDGELLHRALHDELTGLPNRSFAIENADGRLARAERRAVPMAALLLNLDGFSRINAAYPPQVGDELLRAVAQRLTASVRETDEVARLGGDEFIVLTEPSASAAPPELVAERLLSVLRAPLHLPEHMSEPVVITASIGIAFANGGSVQNLLRDATAALTEAKANGKNCVVTFDSRVRESLEDRLALERELPQAVAANQFMLLYEPVVDLHSGQVRAMETHLWWDHPSRGLLDPSHFMNIAEEAGLAAELNRWILEEACWQGAAWEREGLGIIVAVNVSARQLERHGFLGDLEHALAVSAINAARLAIDIPEQAIVSAPAASGALLDGVKALGVSIAIDEFGTGFATPAQLRRLPIDFVKIASSLAPAAAGSAAGRAVFGTLVELAESLGALPIAKGIDSPEALTEVCRERCGFGQGPLIATPLRQDAVDAFLAGWPESSPEFERHRTTAACAADAPPDDEELEVILVDDHLAVRKGIELLLRSEGFRIAGLAGQVSEARELLARRRHDVVLISVHLGSESVLPLVSELLADDPDAAIVLYTGAASAARIRDAVDLGTRGFVLKSSPAARLVDALRSVAAGGTYVDPDLASVLSEESETSQVASLSPREREIFTLLADGLTGQAIADQLYLSPETVKTHIRNATAKLGAKTRVQAVALVVRDAHSA